MPNTHRVYESFWTPAAASCSAVQTSLKRPVVLTTGAAEMRVALAAKMAKVFIIVDEEVLCGVNWWRCS